MILQIKDEPDVFSWQYRVEHVGDIHIGPYDGGHITNVDRVAGRYKFNGKWRPASEMIGKVLWGAIYCGAYGYEAVRSRVLAELAECEARRAGK